MENLILSTNWPLIYTFKRSSNVFLACKLGYYGKNCGTKCPFPLYGSLCTSRCNCNAKDCDFISGCKQSSTLKLTSMSTGKPLSTSTGIQNYQKGFFSFSHHLSLNLLKRHAFRNEWPESLKQLFTIMEYIVEYLQENMSYALFMSI